MPVLLEVCVASVDDALAARAGGADRLEVNAALALGGLTPSAGMFAEVRRRVELPLIVMLRPRPGGFYYSQADFEVMLRDADGLLAAGAEGLAFGILTEGGTIDLPRCRRLVAICGDRPAVFHRAFDVTPDPLIALEMLIEAGFCRVMTSGQEESAHQGIPLIAELVRRAAGRIEILPAAGINPLTVSELIQKTGCDQVHASLRSAVRDRSVLTRPNVRFGNARLTEEWIDGTDANTVAELRAALGH